MYQPLERADVLPGGSERIEHVISRIDLRGDALPRGPRPARPAAPSRLRRRGRPGEGAAHLRGRASSGRRGADRLRRALRRREARPGPGAGRRAGARPGRARPGRARRPGGVDPPGPPGPPRAAPHHAHHPGRARRHGHREVGPGRPRRPVRAGRPVRLPVLRDHERGARPGGRCPVPRARLPAQAGFGGLPHPTILAACALLGVDEVYAAGGGATAVAMFAYGTESCPPANMVTGPGNIWVAAPSVTSPGRSASTPRPARPRSRSSRTPRPTRCTSPPT